MVHISHDDYDVKICRPSVYGNPFSAKDKSIAAVKVSNRTEAIENHKKWIFGALSIPGLNPPTISDIRNNLTSKRLACWCHPRTCHGDIYVEICSWKEDEVEKKTEAIREFYRQKEEPEDLF